MWVTRKGAIEANTHNFAMIPGSMGTRSYIVVGQGASAELLLSAARRRPPIFAHQGPRAVHDGRPRPRDGRHRVPAIRSVLLDEIPGAYKDIDQVMEHARDLVEVRHVLKQFVNVKGD